MGLLNVSRFYRNGTSKFVLIGSIGRSGAVGVNTSEGWERASGTFNDDETIAPGLYSDIYSDIYDAGEVTGGPMTVAAPTWVTNKAETTAVLVAAVNATLTGAGYTRPDGSAIT